MSAAVSGNRIVENGNERYAPAMRSVKLSLIPRDEFAGFNLQQRNEYLRKLATDFCQQTGQMPLELDSDALARLRRFYLRRSFADLDRGKVDLRVKDPGLAEALRRFGETIKNEGRQADLVGVLKAELPGPVLREAPNDDRQFSLFVPAIYDAPVKDDVNLMDVAPFSIAKNKRTTMIRYELKDSIITVDGSAEHGLATVFDYDIFLHMVSYLAEEARRYHIDISKGLRPSLPARVYRPNASHILKFCRRSSGGKQYKNLEAALDRLAGTRIKSVPLYGGKRREVVNVPLIDKYRIVSETTNGNVDEIEIHIPTWVYEMVVREKGTPQILTMNPDYFLISQGLGRMIYRLARRTAAKGEARYSLAEVHKRSGSPQGLPQFSHMLRQLVESSKLFPFPDYDLDLVEGRESALLRMRFRKQPELSAQQLDTLPLAAHF